MFFERGNKENGSFQCCTPLCKCRHRVCLRTRRVGDPEHLGRSLGSRRAAEVRERRNPGRHAEATVVQTADHLRSVGEFFHVEVKLTVASCIAIVNLQLTAYIT